MRCRLLPELLVSRKGDKVYWDNTAKETTKTATSNTLIGVAVEAVSNGASDTVGRLRLNGSY